MNAVPDNGWDAVAKFDRAIAEMSTDKPNRAQRRAQKEKT